MMTFGRGITVAEPFDASVPSLRTMSTTPRGCTSSVARFE